MLTGYEAIEHAEITGERLYKYADPIEGHAEVTVEQAYSIARIDSSLIYCEGKEKILYGYNVAYNGKNYLTFAPNPDEAKRGLAFLMKPTPLGRKRAQNKMIVTLVQDEE